MFSFLQKAGTVIELKISILRDLHSSQLAAVIGDGGPTHLVSEVSTPRQGDSGHVGVLTSLMKRRHGRTHPSFHHHALSCCVQRSFHSFLNCPTSTPVLCWQSHKSSPSLQLIQRVVARGSSALLYGIPLLRGCLHTTCHSFIGKPTVHSSWPTHLYSQRIFLSRTIQPQ